VSGSQLGKNGFHVVRSNAQGRYLRLGYFISRIEPYNNVLYRLLSKIITRVNWGGIAIPVNFGDLFTLYAYKT
jgi:hypothetical protein